jgi:hypothetical protein
VRRAALTFVLMLAQGCSAQTDLYLIGLMGQSNMEGRGELSDTSGRLSRKSHEDLELRQCL